MNIVLIGYRGVGKSVVGRILAEKLGKKRICIDEQIVESAGISIPEIVARFGWPYFRELETKLALSLAAQDNLVIDTGGGVIEREENVLALRKNGLLFWLQATPETIAARIQASNDRPALTEGKTFLEEISEVLARRTPKYRAAAHYEISTDLQQPLAVAAQIEEIIRR